MNLRFFRPLALGAAALVAAPAALAQPIDVAIVTNDGSAASAQSLLQAFASDFSSVDIINVNSGLPTLAQLQGYNAVLTYANSFYPDPAGLGNVMADYLESGGSIVTGVFDSQTPMTGRFESEGYYCYAPIRDDAGIYSAGSLGAFDASSPLMENVTSFSTTNFRMGNVPADPGATVVASYGDGQILVIECEEAGAQRVDLGFFPPGPGFGVWDPSTSDGDDMMRNALLYVAGVTSGEPPAVTGGLDYGTCPEALPAGRFTCAVEANGQNNLVVGQRYTVFLRVAETGRIAFRGETKPEALEDLTQNVRFRTVASDPFAFTLELVVEMGAVAAPSGEALVIGSLAFTKGAGLRADEALTAYPNPTAGSATLRFAVAEQAEATLVVYDALGREVARPVDGAVSGVVEAAFDGSDLPAGLYVARLTTAGGTETVRLSVVR